MKLLQKHKSLISYFSFSMATSALGFVAALAMMRLMPPEEYGRIALFLSMQFIGVPLISFAADSLIAIKKSKLDPNKYEYFRSVYVTFAYLMFTVVQVSFVSLYAIGLLRDSLLLLIPFYGLIRFLIGMASTEFVMEEEAFRYGVIAFSTTFTSLALTILLLISFSRVADWRIVSLLLADILFLFVRYRGRLKLLWTFCLDKAIFKEIVQFGFPLLLTVAPAWGLNESDKIIVAQNADMTALGYYAAACTIGSIMITFNIAMLNSLTPKIYTELSNKPGATMSIISRNVIKCLGTASTFGFLFTIAYWLTAELILPEKYFASRKIVYVVILFSLGRVLYSVLGLVTDYYAMTMVKLKSVVYGCITTVVVAIIGVANLGVIGAAIGVGSGYLVISTLLWFALKEKSRTL